MLDKEFIYRELSKHWRHFAHLFRISGFKSGSLMKIYYFMNVG